MNSAKRWSLGLFMAFLNCTLSSAGFTIQRKAHLLANQEKPPMSDVALRLLWFSGVALYVLAALPDVVSYALIPQMVCTAVACFRLVLVTVLSHTCLHEHVHRREVLGMLACTVGTFLCLCFGPMSEDTDAARKASPTVIDVYAFCGLSILVALLFLEHREELGCGVASEAVRTFTLPCATGLAFGLEKAFNTEIGFMHPPGNSIWTLWRRPLFDITAVAIALLGVTDFYLNLRGAQRMPVQVFVPAAFALATSLQYVQSVAIFGEFRGLDNTHAFISGFGALLSLLGAVVIKPPAIAALCCPHVAEGDRLMAEEAEEVGSTNTEEGSTTTTCTETSDGAEGK